MSSQRENWKLKRICQQMFFNGCELVYKKIGGNTNIDLFFLFQRSFAVGRANIMRNRKCKQFFPKHFPIIFISFFKRWKNHMLSPSVPDSLTRKDRKCLRTSLDDANCQHFYSICFSQYICIYLLGFSGPI